MSQGKKSTVLLIEADASLRRLIALGLQHRGMHVVEASSPPHMLSVEMPDLLIVDVDNGIRSDWSLLTDVQASSSLASVPTVVLAWESLFPLKDTTTTITQTQITCLTKPFDVRIMHESIDQLLADSAAKEAAIIARAEEALLASYATHAAPSIWPIITAIGLLVAFIGMMLHIAIVAAGLLIVFFALLRWMLGTQSEQRVVPVTVGSRCSTTSV